MGLIKQEGLEQLYLRFNPVYLRAQIDATLGELWKHAVYPKHAPNKSGSSVTLYFDATRPQSLPTNLKIC